MHGIVERERESVESVERCMEREMRAARSAWNSGERESVENVQRRREKGKRRGERGGRKKSEKSASKSG